MNSLNVMLENDCATYCELDDRFHCHPDSSKTLNADIFGRIIDCAKSHDLHVNLLSGKNTAFLDRYELQLDGVSHTWLVPVASKRDRSDENVVYVANANEDEINQIPDGTQIAIIKYNSGQLDKLIPILHRAFTKHIARVNLALKDLIDLDERFIPQYRNALRELADYSAALMEQGDAVEVDMLTDRLFLREMNNCSAGETHMTVAPNGRVYPCPAFFHAQNVPFRQGIPMDFDYGEFCGDALFPKQNNVHLFSLNHAPICQACDAYHCRRCCFLSWVKTLDVCVPSRIQCLKANCEREATRYLYEIMCKTGIPTRFGDMMKKLRYLDPLDLCMDHGFPMPGQELESDVIYEVPALNEI
jgi:CXXX repeat peptide maturase